MSGFSVASLERTALDCMADLEFRNSLAIADSYLRRSGREPYEARDEFESLFPHCPGIVQARRVLPLADARSENGWRIGGDWTWLCWKSETWKSTMA